MTRNKCKSFCLALDVLALIIFALSFIAYFTTLSATVGSQSTYTIVTIYLPDYISALIPIALLVWAQQSQMAYRKFICFLATSFFDMLVVWLLFIGMLASKFSSSQQASWVFAMQIQFCICNNMVLVHYMLKSMIATVKPRVNVIVPLAPPAIPVNVVLTPSINRQSTVCDSREVSMNVSDIE